MDDIGKRRKWGEGRELREGGSERKRGEKTYRKKGASRKMSLVNL